MYQHYFSGVICFNPMPRCVALPVSRGRSEVFDSIGCPAGVFRWDFFLVVVNVIYFVASGFWGGLLRRHVGRRCACPPLSYFPLSADTPRVMLEFILPFPSQCYKFKPRPAEGGHILVLVFPSKLLACAVVQRRQAGTFDNRCSIFNCIL
jgi:hypothetical protein